MNKHKTNSDVSLEKGDAATVVYGALDTSSWTPIGEYDQDSSIGSVTENDLLIEDSLQQLPPKRTIPEIIDKYIKNEVSGKLIYVNQIQKVQDIELVSTHMRKYISPNLELANQITQEDYTYIIQHPFDLNPNNNEELPTLVVPRGVTLEFTGGGLLKNCILFGKGATIKASKRIFENVYVQGIWNCPGDVTWFSDGTEMIKHEQWGYVFPSLKDKSAELQLALDSAFRELHFPPKYYYITQSLLLTKEKKIIMHGSAMKASIGMTNAGRPNNCVIFSDQNITLLTVAVNESTQNSVYIEGGNFDVSQCDGYTESCIKFLANTNGQKMWGVTINTNVKGRYNQTTGIGIDINPIPSTQVAVNEAYVTQIRINSVISDFGIGVKATDGGAELAGAENWVSDIVVDGAILNCPVAVETNCDSDIRAMLQSGKFFDTKENGVPLIRIKSDYTSSVSSNIFDIRQQDSATGKWSNEYALEVTGDGTVTADGHFRAFYIGCTRLGWPIVNGNVEA